MKEFIKREVVPFVIITAIVVMINIIIMLNSKGYELNKKIVVDENEISLEFNRLESNVLIYKDNKDDEYIFSNGKLIGYNKNFDE